MLSPKPKPEEVQITMLGASRVGKTSLLCAIYSQFTDTIGSVGNLELIPDVVTNTSALLGARLAELKTLADEIVVKPDKGVKGSADAREFIFSIRQKDKENGLRLRFVDYPGGYLGVNATEEERGFILNLMQFSDVVIIAIDAAALMETDAEEKSWHESINRSRQIYDLFKDAYHNLKSPRLVILSPVKCEKYMLAKRDSRRQINDQSPDDLLKKIELEYKNLIDYFQAKFTNVAVVVTPVQTTGCVFYRRIEFEEILDKETQDEVLDKDNKKDKIPTFRFKKRSKKFLYDPQDSEQPLLWLLPFLLQISLVKRPWYQKMLAWMLELDKEIKKSIKLLESKRKTTDGFKLIQGEHLVKMR